MALGNLNEIQNLLRSDPRLVVGGQTEIIIKYNGDIEKVARQVGAVVEILRDGYAIMTIGVDQIPGLLSFKEVEYLELPKTLTFELYYNISVACITRIHGQRFGLRGNGTIIGIIDSGIDYTHPDFINDDGTSRILFAWDQFGTGEPPAGFRSGVEYTNAKINEALRSPNPFEVVPLVDTIGHGTAVSAIAAGNGRASEGTQIGVAPEANLIVVKLGQVGYEAFARTTEIMRAIKYISDKAEALGMPVSINLSYGTNNGPHDGNTLFENYIDDVSQKWKTVISVASGNEGAAGHHFAGTAVQGRTTSVDFTTPGDVYKIYVSMWKNFNDSFVYSIVAPSGDRSSQMRPTTRFLFDNLDGVRITGFNVQPTIYTTFQELYFLFEGEDKPIPQGLWRIEIYGEQVVDGRFDIWLPNTDDVSYGTAFVTPDTSLTLTLPSTAAYVISVGGYNGRTGTLAAFSGRGYTRGNVMIKPDLVAPAVDIITAVPGGGYDRFSGTSMAAPFVTGAAALMMEWGVVRGHDRFLYGQRVKAFLQKGARRDHNITYPNNQWGYGTLCLENSMLLLYDYTGGGTSI